MDAPWNARIFSLGSRMWSGALCVRPHEAAVHTPRACMEIRRSGPNRRSALEALRITLVFPTPVSLTVCPYPLIDLITFSTTPNAIDASRANRARSLVDPTFRHQSPGDPRYAVRQRHRDDKAGLFFNMRSSQDPSGAPLREAHRTTVIAPLMSNRRKSR